MTSEAGWARVVDRDIDPGCSWVKFSMMVCGVEVSVGKNRKSMEKKADAINAELKKHFVPRSVAEGLAEALELAASMANMLPQQTLGKWTKEELETEFRKALATFSKERKD